MRHKKIIHYLSSVESATLHELYVNSDYSYYRNWTKHFGMVISRLVKAGLIERVKPGVFRLNKNGLTKNRQTNNESDTQPNLFTS